MTQSEKPRQDPWLLTPGPLTTSRTVKEAMLHDYGSRDQRFIDINRRVRERLIEIIDGQTTHVCVPLQGSGTFVVEAMLSNFVPSSGKVLILVNGAYGTRMQSICEYHGLVSEVLQWPEDEPVDPDAVAGYLAGDPKITHVAVVHCETTTGILNPIGAVGEAVAAAGRSLLIDSMSAFGALSVSARKIQFDALVASSNKCLEGAPGMGFCLASESALTATQGNSDSLCLDLYQQWQGLEANGQWRFTPPTHCILAFDQALNEFDAEGSVAGRGGRYRENCEVLVSGMRAMGFETLLPDALQAPIIVTFKMPADSGFDFQQFYDGLSERGYVIYPGKLTIAESFRMGCIGRLGVDEMYGALEAVRTVMVEMGVASGSPSV
ncbi:MAG TPA: 2-aminoethylphosphonate--pyruvate transaminase [Gammaproteobacteria bacterium]|nr:2-aminoethylphosphonate--pyruvate transaminase [Arenicellales bacterium]MDP6552847.1 2-aminoethylphosphonate--pyruvate transaminase [Arenicellales bacterium]MDP6791080.1 2-aminoethylphosphonate--pyruvate transaminase [Arenicellales bacterium]MDP6919088.1 2-aminoethylphosphonate--pyruvate transaminase [Arenicellales bacterium]HCX86560.1 2-aminoethylphosphonate--pyruvate transaminase [Gammaproteobacteria bacterium]